MDSILDFFFAFVHTFYAIRFDPFAAYAQKRLIGALKMRKPTQFTNRLYAPSFTVTYALRIQATDEKDRLRKEMTG